MINLEISHDPMWVFPKIGGKPPKWMVKIRENPIRIDDLGGNTPIFGNTHVKMVLCHSLARHNHQGWFTGVKWCQVVSNHCPAFFTKKNIGVL